MNKRASTAASFAHDIPESGSCLYWCLFAIAALIGGALASELWRWLR